MIASLFAAAYGTVEDIEVLWTLIASLGAAFSIYNLRSAREDVALLEEAGVINGRMKLARVARVSEACRLAKQLIFALVGVLVMFLPTPPPTDLPIIQAVVGVVIRWGLIIAAALTAFQSVLAWLIRRELQRQGD